VLVAGGEEGDGVNMMEQIDQAIGERDRLLAENERLREALKMASTADENLLCDNGYTLGYVVKAALDGKEPRD